MPKKTADIVTFRHAVRTFIRGFGLLSETKTPCGEAVPIAQAHVITVLAEAEGTKEITRGDLVGELRIDKSNVTRLLVHLERARIVRSLPDARDARQKRIRLTEKGHEIAARLDSASKQKFADLFENIPSRNRKTVIKAIQDLAAITMNTILNHER